MRITENLLTKSFLSYSNTALARMARLQEMISSGRKILRPSDDPSALGTSLALRSNLRSVDAFRDNASAATAVMSLTESSLAEVSDLLSRAKELIVGAMNGTTDEAAAEAQALEISQMIDTVLLIANREIAGRSLFGGHQTLANPYVRTSGGVTYQGDLGELVEELGPGLRVVVNLTGPQAFQTVASQISGAVDLNPAASTITPLADLAGGAGVSTGHIRITDSDNGSAEIDLLGAQNLGDVIEGINGAGLAVTASLSGDGKSIVLTDTGGGGSELVVEDLFGGTLAQELGIVGSSETGEITGADLDPALTEATPMALLLQGAGIGAGTWTIRNDSEGAIREATIDPTRANTVGDLLDLLENAETESGGKLGIRASLDKTGVIIESTILHTRLSVADEGGTSARALGIAATGEARDVFALLEDAAAAVRSRDPEVMDRMLREITSAVENTAGARGTYGARSRQVLSLAENLDDQKVDLTIRLSDVEDVDLAQAAIELAQSETIYNASLASGSRLFELNLFNFIR